MQLLPWEAAGSVLQVRSQLLIQVPGSACWNFLKEWATSSFIKGILDQTALPSTQSQRPGVLGQEEATRVGAGRYHNCFGKSQPSANKGLSQCSLKHISSSCNLLKSPTCLPTGAGLCQDVNRQAEDPKEGPVLGGPQLPIVLFFGASYAA